MLGMLLAAAVIAPSTQEIRVLNWNVWRGGDQAMDAADPEDKRRRQQSIIDVIRREEVDVVAMVETYGSGEVFAAGLGFHFLPRGTNVSIFSRWPIEKDVSVYKPFHCVGAIIRHPSGRRFALYSVWIHYVDDIWTDPRSRDGRSVADLLAKDGDSRKVEVQAIVDEIAEKLKDEGPIPVIVAGDFNSNSHLDYVESARPIYGEPVAWPVTKIMESGGYQDSYRVCNPVIDRMKDRTWSPRFPEQIQDRIDFTFWKGDRLEAVESRMVDQAVPRWPSDHAAVFSRFRWRD
ncbi:MAG: endonuclease/exonuclease/phosphatase family protein [Fimbriimonadaceae bacterium]|nr:endonuclease/exonuclease/phosphatase family protein [Fimbriimonadaceae bacterium]